MVLKLLDTSFFEIKKVSFPQSRKVFLIKEIFDRVKEIFHDQINFPWSRKFSIKIWSKRFSTVKESFNKTIMKTFFHSQKKFLQKNWSKENFHKNVDQENFQQKVSLRKFYLGNKSFCKNFDQENFSLSRKFFAKDLIQEIFHS